jgi:biopolymer transport protein ExbD/biopolymer transport protein TolR
MSMSMRAAGRRGAPAADINVTPMIDVLLVLLIIFMVVQQGLQRGLALQVPPPERAAPPVRDPASIVLEVMPGGRYALNTQPVGAEGLQSAVEAVFRGRPRKVLWVKGGEGVRYGEVAAAVDASRAAGVQVVGLVPRSGGA